MAASFREILDAFEFVSFEGGVGEHQAVLCRETGKIYLRSDFADMDDETPDDIDDAEKYLEIPNRRQLDLGKPLIMDFVREFLPNDFDEVRHIFSKRGAYQKFRALLSRRHAVDRWYDYESKATERALREWCELKSITITD
jgi:hypothetical protein